MTNEEFQNLVLSELRALRGDMTGVQADISGMKTDMAGMKTDMSAMQATISGMQTSIDGIESQLDEGTQIVKAIRHSQEMTNAKLEGLELTAAKASAVSRLDGKFEVLNRRLFDQETEIQVLKLAK